MTPGLLRTARVWTPRTPEDGTRILAVRHLNERAAGYFDMWEPALSPSAGLLATAQKMAKEDGDAAWAWYVPRFTEEMEGPTAREKMWALFLALLMGRTATLMCYCADERRCHRMILAELLEGMG